MNGPARGPIRRGSARHRAPAPRRRSSLGPLLFVLVIVALLGIAAFVARPLVLDAVAEQAVERDVLMRQPFVRALIAPRVGEGPDLVLDRTAEARPFEVRRGEAGTSVAARLRQEGFIADTLPFVFVLYDTGRERSLQAGTYRISSAMTPRELARAFERAPGDQAILKIIEGWRLSEVATAVNRALPHIERDAFLAAAVVGQRRSPSLAGLDPATPLEGFLFPDTYFVRPDITAAGVVDLLLSTFERRAGAMLRAAAAERRTTVHDIVKIASIVEREARDRSESERVAGVYWNRVRIGMKLDADPTIQYALGEWRELSLQDLRLPSPYNTYIVPGLPPTPICMPGIRAIEGAVRPESHDFLFFVADRNGRHVFARTLDEHEANRVRVGNR